MSEELCAFSLIIPPRLVWWLMVVGGVLFAVAAIELIILPIAARMNWQETIIVIRNVSPLLLAILGLVPLLLGGAGMAAISHQPLGRWLGELVPKLIDQIDPAASADLNDKPLGEIETSTTGKYTVRMSSAARSVRVSGTFKNAACDADLIFQICRNNSNSLECNVDESRKVLRVCAKSDAAACTGRSL